MLVDEVHLLGHPDPRVADRGQDAHLLGDFDRVAADVDGRSVATKPIDPLDEHDVVTAHPEVASE
ncbi:hypothetical protein AB0J40_08840 [Amycolatopsis sp. NPDC049691]|uniref:hypothetical protein n=1 Tax=Amycolatopsis sp. NPDC049691 TaxID=3155155 RepID=UPI00342B357D